MLTDDQRESAFRALQRCVEIAGSQSEFERQTGAKQQKVSYWLKNRRLLPGEYVLAAEKAFGVSRHHLRPDIYPLGLQEGAPYPFQGPGISDAAAAVAFNRGAILQAGLAK